ncbi:L-histidine N(alpha)-methyltransferase [Alcanivorax sp.]|jgi:dimethylhistidine N-methyltransferase|uniref:L-histidine N(alpha)-methyltransferase n=1 Tax=Alcanivorax sp. TaxID=1872427 RepID=UPI0032D99EF8
MKHQHIPLNHQQLCPNLTFYDLYPPATDMLAEVSQSLCAPNPSLHPKYFYDEAGSTLFDRITRTPEYYPTRTETSLLTDYAEEIRARLNQPQTIAEPGAGSCEKVRLLLDAWQPRHYMPLEISRECLLGASHQLAHDFPDVHISAVCADYCQAMAMPQALAEPGRVVFFPGSTIGNFEPAARADFLKGLRTLAGPGGALLIGADLQKPDARLNAAYNDAEGLTAAFNLNALHHLNRELGCQFDTNNVQHVAFYNAARQRIEMHLECLGDQHIQLGERTLTLKSGTRIHTENSYKFTVEGFSAELVAAGLTPLSCWTDPQNLFSLHLAQV